MRPRCLPLASLALVFGGCAPSPVSPVSPGTPVARNVVLISVDTLRADRLGLYGYERETSPELDTFAARGAVVERAVSESGWTLPAHVTMLSGLPPASHGVVLPEQRVGDDTLLLAEALRDAGFRTFGATDGGYVSGRHGFGRGFERFEDERDGLEEELWAARSFVDNLAEGERYFLFLHTYDVHCPYEPDESVARLFRSADAEFIETRGKCGNPDFNSLSLGPGQVRWLSDQYDAGIREADALLGAFFRWLEERGALETTLVVITSDHGEELHEHGRIGHERSVYREVLEVPLVFVGPGIPAARVRASMGLAQVAPTIVELLGLGPVLGGTSAAAAIRGASAPPTSSEPRISEVAWPARLRSVMTETHHLIVDDERSTVELYALATDPDERVDRSTADARIAGDLRALLDEHARSGTADAPLIDGLDPERLEELRALGYGE